MSAASYKMTEMIPSTSAHLIDRSEDVIFELVWVIKRSILSFPVYITQKMVQSVLDSAVLHWTTWLMVFPRNAGFGRCYLVSTRHEILSNIDQNLTGTRLRLRKKRNKIIPREYESHPSYIAVIWVSNSSFPAFRLSSKKVHNQKKFHFHNHMALLIFLSWLQIENYVMTAFSIQPIRKKRTANNILPTKGSCCKISISLRKWAKFVIVLVPNLNSFKEVTQSFLNWFRFEIDIISYNISTKVTRNRCSLDSWVLRGSLRQVVSCNRSK